MFSGDDFSNTSRYFLDKNIVDVAKSSQFAGSSSIEE